LRAGPSRLRKAGYEPDKTRVLAYTFRAPGPTRRVALEIEAILPHGEWHSLACG